MYSALYDTRKNYLTELLNTYAPNLECKAILANTIKKMEQDGVEHNVIIQNVAIMLTDGLQFGLWPWGQNFNR
jgi:hypothetical protein